ncbi:MAG: hypothetical protein SOZ59_08160 [Candidatus Limivivens sp.]|nr:hypothetical protein [Candidatus Limivivens sp.]
MKKRTYAWKCGLLLSILLVWLCGLQVFAGELSGDNSLYTLGIENGTIEPEFYYSTVNYTVTVAPGTTELILNPVCSNENAQIISIDGTTLDNGSGTVTITVRAQNGADAVYTLTVQPDPTAETEPPTETEAPTEPQTEPQTEAPATEPQTTAQTEDSATIIFLNGQISQFREKLDFSMKVIYGLIALAVILMFLSINLLLKNRDLKDDLRDAEDHLDFQTNEFARKEKMMDTDNYYAPVQAAPTPAPEAQPVAVTAEKEADENVREEPKARGRRGRKEEKAAQNAEQNAVQNASVQAVPEPEKKETEAPAEEKDVDVTMVEL